MGTKHFSLGHILSITTGVLACENGLDGVYDILNFMTDDDLYDVQLGRACDECVPYLIDQFPQLKHITAEMIKGPHVFELIKPLIAQFGNDFEVSPIPMDDHTITNPIDEFIRLREDTNVTVILIDATDKPNDVGDINWKVEE